MWQSIFSLLFFGILLSGVWLGVSWIVDNKQEFTRKEGVSITEIAKVVENEMKEVGEKMQEETQEQEPLDIDRSRIDVLVLNGGAEAGSAGDTAKKLAEEGFSQAEASNASSYEYTGVTVYYDGEQENEAKEVVETLTSLEGYSDIKKEQASLADHQRADIVVILGQ